MDGARQRDTERKTGGSANDVLYVGIFDLGCL